MLVKRTYQKTSTFTDLERKHIEKQALKEAMPFIVNLLTKTADFLSYEDKQEFVHLGVIAFLKELRKFDHQLSKQFYKCANMRIRGEFIDEIRRRDPMNRDTRLKLEKIKLAFKAISKEKGSPASIVDVSRHLGMTVEEISKTLDAEVTYVDMDESFVEQRTHSFGDLEDVVNRSALAEKLSLLLKQLPELVQKIMYLSLIEEFTVTEISKILNITRYEAHAKKQQGLNFLKKNTEGWEV